MLNDSPWGLRSYYGEPFQNMHFADYHKWAYSEFTLTSILLEIGFSKVYKRKPQIHGQRQQADLRIIAIK